MTNNNTEVVYLPSATRPGTRFVGFTTPEIRQRNLTRWQRTEARYRNAKAAAAFLSNAVKAAFDTAQTHAH